MDSNEFNGANSKMNRIMAQKLKASKEFEDKEFDDAVKVALIEDKALLEKLAKV